MNVYIEPLIDKLLELWKGVTMYDISRQTNEQREFQFHVMLVWTIYHAPGLTHFFGTFITLRYTLIVLNFMKFISCMFFK